MASITSYLLVGMGKILYLQECRISYQFIIIGFLTSDNFGYFHSYSISESHIFHQIITFLLCIEAAKSGPRECHKALTRLSPNPVVSLYSQEHSGISHVCQCPPELLKLQDQHLGQRRGSQAFNRSALKFLSYLLCL